MVDTPSSPIICITCHRPFPDDLDPDKAPHYFAQYNLLPKTDEMFEFASEVQTLLRYMQAISTVWTMDRNMDVSDETYTTLFELLAQLSEEALRRMDLSLEAYREIEKRDSDAKKALAARKEGRA